MRAVVKQHPVGQGGLHTIRVLPNVGAEFSCVYDCGSSNAKPLARELRILDEELDPDRVLDVLFLSHLDEDHVNGVETLLATRDVHTVVIPYLGVAERFVLVARAAERLTESSLDLYEDPIAWFGRRGAREIVEVDVSGDDGPPLGEPNVDLDPDAGDHGEFVLAGHVAGTPTKKKGQLIQRRRLEPGGLLRLSRAGQPLWELVPFWKPTDDAEAFRKEVRRTLKVGPSLKALRAVLREKPKRRLLAELYSAHFGDRNLTSMALYSAPLWSRGWPRSSVPPQVVQNGWLHTGDAPLRNVGYRTAFRRFYGSRIERTLVFSLPHHGSALSFSVEGLPNLEPQVWLALAGKNPYGHPSPVLTRKLQRLGLFVHVSSKAHSAWGFGWPLK